MNQTDRVLFVPSCGITPVNTLTHGDTLIRCQKALELWKTGKYDIIFLCGGIFNPPHIQTRAASELMAEWFVLQGDLEEYLVLERKSLDTYGNITFFLDAWTEMSLAQPEVTVVTQWQHAIRIFITFFLAHGTIVRIHPLFYRISWKTFLMEWVMIFYHLFDWKGTGRVARRNRESRRQKK
ncbi:MAG: hypothetical protein G01um101418_489 [Parcubacteria group bacterium Gr01-1014_18]|nr:MAG: hypothetical protein Greene041636_535 [Parcubacteria group bacterium Greene0416_36]TSC81076.1 MAG: hypothetical protein G01um101418_489 [Parcubacteria group bacterium Gr01-1014_18]TSC98810.1 MAG: hypothetical protein Greene101420_560 [Parcubacteria group bacterium Greene1014_20]TSD06710.1 MAG: hypothetical protein Greene07142_631 [Parcubacteria group bacterium Greene0714_2]